jgi:cell division transport system permease protein
MARLRYFSRETLVSLQRNLMMTIAGILTVSVSLALFGGSMLLSKWVGHGTEHIEADVTAEIFMNLQSTDQQISDTRAALAADPDIRKFRFVDHEEALKTFQRIFKDQPELVKSIRAKDLPVSFRLSPKEAALTPIVQRRYQAQAGVDTVATPGDQVKKMLEVTDKVRLILFILSAALLVSSMFLIVNTIRLATFARRREIEVMKLVGASNWFIRIPFLAEGLVQGLVGAALAIGVVVALKFLGFDTWFQNPDQFFSQFFVTTSDAVVVSILVALAGIAIGLIGSTMGLRRFLRT